MRCRPTEFAPVKLENSSVAPMEGIFGSRPEFF
jgi:hypothetical protein